MNRRNVIIAALAAILTIIAVPLLFAQGRLHREHAAAMGMGVGPLGHLAHAKQELGLSDQQVEEIKAIFQNLRQQNTQYREQMRGGLQDVIDTLIQNPTNVAAAQAQLDAQAQAERVLKTNLLNAASKALGVLTPEQRTKLASMVAEHRAAREARGPHRF